MRIAEIYRSIQGEGLLTGVPSVFVHSEWLQFAVLVLRHAVYVVAARGRDMSTDEIVAQVEEWLARHVVVTGGEPMLFAELLPLCNRLRAIGRHVTIETAGTLYLPVECDLMSISPKFASSAPPAQAEPHWHRRHERERHRPDVIRQLVAEFEYQVKFVIDTPADLDEVNRYLAEFPEIGRDRVLLMPQGVDQEQLDARAQWLRPHCHDAGLIFCPRKQIEWFGPVRGT